MKRRISIILSVLIILSLLPVASFAASGSKTVVVQDGQTLTPDNYHGSNRTHYVVNTDLHNSGYQNIKTTLYFKVPSKCAFTIDAVNGGNVLKNDVSISGEGIDVFIKKKTEFADSKGVEYICNAAKAGMVKVVLSQEMTLAGIGSSVIDMVYIPDKVNTIKASSGWKSYTHGASGIPTNTSKFKVKVPANGYLILDLADGTEQNEAIHAKTTGMGFETFNADYPQKYIGVKKGTYTFNVQTNAAYYKIRTKFVKVKEGAYGTSKAKAKTLKKNSARKGLIIVNGKVSKKTHWYKFKLNKNAETKVTINTLLNGGGGYNGLNVYIYGKSGLVKKEKIKADAENTVITLSSKDLYGKLKKGTYYIKIQNASKGNGYFTVKWS